MKELDQSQDLRQLKLFVRRLARTQETEIDCGECSRLSPYYVDALLNNQDSRIHAGNTEHWLLFQSHLEQCPVCSQEFVTLCAVARMELDGSWPARATLLDWATQGETQA